MHEASIAQGILHIAIGALPSEDTRILRIVLVVGVLSNIQAESLRLYLTELSAGTAAQGAELVVKPEPARLTCQQCGTVTEYDGAGCLEVACPRCGGPHKLEGGSALYIDHLEVES